MALTNEQLFDLIKDGNEDLKPVLWERVKSLAYMLSSRFNSQNKELCRSRGFEEWDIKQLSYIAYASLFETYSTDKNYAYSTALGYALRNELRTALGKKTDVLSWDNSSLDDTIGEDEDGQPIAETVADETSSAPFEEIEDSSEQEAIGKTLHEEIAKLPEQEQTVINSRYFSGKTFTAISEEMNVSRERINQIHKRAIRDLRKPRILRRLRDDLGYSSYRLYKNQVEYIATERAYLESKKSRAASNADEYAESLLKEFTDKEEADYKQHFEKLCKDIKRTQGFDLAAFNKAYKENKEQAKANIKSFYFENECITRVSIWD